MSIFSVSTSLVGPVRIHYGFWFAQSSTHQPGLMLTLSNFYASYLSIALGLLVGWAISRLWRISCAILFYFSYTANPSWEESQNNVFIVNSTSPLEGLTESYGILRSRAKVYRPHRSGRFTLLHGNTSPRYRRAKYIIISVMGIGFITVILKLAVPLLISLVPLTKTGPLAAKNCGGHDGIWIEQTATSVEKSKNWITAVFAILDRYPDSEPETDQNKLPDPQQSIVFDCPGSVSGCSTKHPFTFSSNYSLSDHHFGLNVESSFSLRVSESCYRPSWDRETSRINSTEAGNEDITTYGFYYGPIVTRNGTILQNYTQAIMAERPNDAPPYFINAESVQDSPIPGGWSPSSALVQGGDTTFLLYYLPKSPTLEESSSDPIFSTKSSDSYYVYEESEVPIICDTKYVFCAGKPGEDCSAPGGINALKEWLKSRQEAILNDIERLLEAVIVSPLIYVAIRSREAVAAGQVTTNGTLARQNATAFGELSRLTKTGMVMWASYVQLSATGYWYSTLWAPNITTEADPNSLCNKVIMESLKVTTIPVIPYSMITICSLVIVSVSYSSSLRFVRKTGVASIGRLFNIWALHRPGQLHREATERLRGRDFKFNNRIDPWPSIPYQSGPSIITREGSERFISGRTGLLENIPDSKEKYPLSSTETP